MKKLLSLLLIIGLLAGCAGLAKTPDQMTSKERATYVMTLYNNAYTNYNAQYSATPRPFSKEMAIYFQGYKRVMESAWPIISVYASVAQTNGTPTQEQEQAIISLIYQLQSILIKEGK